MRLYLSGSLSASEPDAFKHGLRSRLISYAEIDPQMPRGNWVPHAQKISKFWIDRESDEMKLYIAGNGKSQGSSQRDYDTGVRSRLLSYAFIADWAKDEFE
jgi:hypothetical protein